MGLQQTFPNLTHLSKIDDAEFGKISRDALRALCREAAREYYGQIGNPDGPVVFFASVGTELLDSVIPYGRIRGFDQRKWLDPLGNMERMTRIPKYARFVAKHWLSKLDSKPSQQG